MTLAKALAVLSKATRSFISIQYHATGETLTREDVDRALAELKRLARLETRKKAWLKAGKGYRLVSEGSGWVLKDHTPGLKYHTFCAKTLEDALDLAGGEYDNHTR